VYRGRYVVNTGNHDTCKLARLEFGTSPSLNDKIRVILPQLIGPSADTVMQQERHSWTVLFGHLEILPLCTEGNNVGLRA